jgi:hypothetical protein
LGKAICSTFKELLWYAGTLLAEGVPHGSQWVRNQAAVLCCTKSSQQPKSCQVEARNGVKCKMNEIENLQEQMNVHEVSNNPLSVNAKQKNVAVVNYDDEQR